MSTAAAAAASAAAAAAAKARIRIELGTKNVKVLRVDTEGEVALLLVSDRGGKRQQPGRTRWSFLKDLPPASLDAGGAWERGELPVDGECESTRRLGQAQSVKRESHQQQPLLNGTQRVRSEKETGREAVQQHPPVGGGRDGGLSRTGEEQKERSIAERYRKITNSEPTRRPNEKGLRDSVEQLQQQQQQQQQHRQQSLARAEELEPVGDAGGDSQVPVSVSEHDAPVEVLREVTLPEALSGGADGKDGQPCAGGVVSIPCVPEDVRDLLELKVSDVGGGRPPARRGEGGDSKTPIRDSEALGVFCKRAIKAGDVVVDECALMKVSKGAVGQKAWDVASAVASRYRGAGVSAMDLVQVIVFDCSPPSIQARVLQLFAPDEKVFTARRRKAWDECLTALHQCGFLSPATCSRRVPAVGNGGKAREAGALSEGLGGGQGGGSSWGAERRAILSRVLMICEANIFGEQEAREDGGRALFELTSRFNHSCLPNCTYHVLHGRTVVRATVDVPQGSELFISYLSCEEISCPTPERQEFLLVTKFFECQCSVCGAEHDVWRSFRCPRCRKGAVRPPNHNNLRLRPQQQQEKNKQEQEQEQEQERRRRQASSCPSPDDDANAAGYRPAPGVSACTACGQVPTANWLRSAQAVEEELNVFWEAWSRQKDGNFGNNTVALWENFLKPVYGTGVYLLAEHHLMYKLHFDMAVSLSHQVYAGDVTRTGEVPYHMHQAIAGFTNMLPRPNESTLDLFRQLGFALFRAGCVVAEASGVQNPPPASAGDHCNTYIDLVQTPPPRRLVAQRRRSEATPKCESSSSSSSSRMSGSGMGTEDDRGPGRTAPRRVVGELGDACAVCGRRHGDNLRPRSTPSLLPRSPPPHEEGGEESPDSSDVDVDVDGDDNTTSKNRKGRGGAVDQGQGQGQGHETRGAQEQEQLQKQLYFDGSVHAMRKVIEIASAMYGADEDIVARYRDELQEVLDTVPCYLGTVRSAGNC